MKNVLIITPYFLPSNLASVHRARIISKHLNMYDWNPIILTVNHEDYYGNVDLKLEKLIPLNIRLEKVSAIHIKKTKLFGLTDVSIRGIYSLIAKASQIVKHEKIDLIYVTILPGYGALVGMYIKMVFNIPFILDYQDPWIFQKTPPLNFFKKSTFSYWISVVLERFIISFVDGISAVTDGTLDSLRWRNLLKKDIPIGIFPIGIDNEDLSIAEKWGVNYLLPKPDKSLNLAYLGTITETILPSLEILLEAIKLFNKQNAVKIYLTLIGTSANIGGIDTLNIDGLLQDKDIIDYITHKSGRINYLDSIKTMLSADALFLLGSNEPHYTASKIFPYWISDRSIIGLFHKKSEIVSLSKKIGGVKLITYDDHIKERNILIMKMHNLLTDITEKQKNIIPEKNISSFNEYESRLIAQKTAIFFNSVLAARQSSDT